MKPGSLNVGLPLDRISKPALLPRDLASVVGSATTHIMNSPLRTEGVRPVHAGVKTGPSCGQRLRLMHVVNYLGCGGTEFGVLKLLRGLNSELFEHALCATRLFEPSFVEAHDLDEMLYVAGTSREGLQFPLFRLKNIFLKYRPHIVHTRNWGGLEAVLAARLAKVPIVVHSEHGYEIESLEGFPRRQRLFRRFAYGMTDQVLAVTTDLAAYHATQAWVSPDRIRVLHNGVDAQKFAPNAAARKQSRLRLGFGSNSIVAGSVGRMVPIKDYGSLLKAAEQVVESGVDLHVLLVGEGSELESLKRRTEMSTKLQGRVVFVGASDRIPDLLNAMDVFVLPSLGEGMSNTLLEAMACGLPIVATSVGGNSEVVDDRSGWLVRPGDLDELASRISQLASNALMRQDAGRAARERVVMHFSLDSMLRKYTDLYLGLAEKRGLWSEPLTRALNRHYE